MRNLGDNSALVDDLRTAAASHAGPSTQPSTDAGAARSTREQVFFHFDFRRSLQMHRRMAVTILIIATVVALGYLVLRWNTYKSESLVYVQPAPHRVIESSQQQSWPYDANSYESYIQQQVHDVTRADVLAAAVKKLPGWQGGNESIQEAADRLGSNVEVTRVGTAYEVSIVATASSAEQAAAMSNAVAMSFIESATRQERSGDPQRIDLLRDERDRIVKELASDRAEQEDLSRKLGVAAVGSGPDPVDDQIAQTRAELVKARTAHDEAAGKLTALAGAKTSNAALDAEADQIVAADPGLVSMKTSLNMRRSVLISQMANLTPNHPQYKQDADELAKINSSLDTMARELRAKASAELEQRLKNDLERTAAVESRLNGQIAELTGEAGSAAPRLQRSSELSNDIQRLQNRFSVVDEQYRNLTMENNAPGAVYLASTALPPLHAARLKVLRNAFIVLLAGLVFALGGALLAYNFDPRVYIAADVERVLGFAPMAQIPDLLEVGTGVAEEYMLRLAAAVEHAHQQGLLSSCIFTGVAAGAGASTVSRRVSSMLEAMGRETVLVDAVGAPPPASAGTDLVHAPRGSRSTALLQQMEEETNEETVVITDTAPLLVSGETEYLARFVDSAIVVVESGVTTKAQLREISKTLQRLEVSSVGFVLNRIELANASPDFRQSVRAVEEHLRAQARNFERAASRPESGAEPLPEPPPSLDRLWSVTDERPAIEDNELQNLAAPVAVAAELAPAVEEPAVFVPEPPVAQASVAAQATPPVREAYVPTPRPSVPDWQPIAEPARPEPIRAGEPVIPVPSSAAAAPRPTQTSGITGRPLQGPRPVRTSVPAPASFITSAPIAPAPAASAPSYFASEPPVASAPVRQSAPLHAKPAQVSDPPEESRRAETPAAQQRLEELAADIARRRSPVWGDPQPAPAAAQPIPLPAIKEEPPAPAAERPAVSASIGSELALTSTPAPAPAPAPDDLPYSAASRLGGLRNLMSSLGIRNLQKEPETRKSAPEAEEPEERPYERPIYAQPASPRPPSNGNGHAQPAEVLAAPEIIPPHNETAEHEREREKGRPVKSSRRWDTADDVETLPSKRGQYRKRR